MKYPDIADSNACEMQVIDALADTVCLLLGCMVDLHAGASGSWLDQIETQISARVCGKLIAPLDTERVVVEHNLLLRATAVRSVFDRARDELALFEGRRLDH